MAALSAVRQLLYIGHVWPEPNSSAAGRRTLALLKLLRSQGWQISFACAAAPSSQRYPLAELGIRELPIRLNCDSFDSVLASLQPQMVVFDRFLSEEQYSWRVANVCPQALRVLDTQDLHSLREARHQALKRGDEVMRPAPGDLNSELAQRELAAIWRSDLSLIISEAEMALLQNHYGVSAALLHYYPLLSDGCQPNQADFDDRKHCLCIGNFRHAPNWDALRYLRSELWPEIRRRLPGVQCHIYGAYPPPKAQQLHSEKLGFLLKGWAPDAGEVMRRARLCLAPLRFGAGQKGKLLEAMEYGTPSVTTAVGAEAMVGQGVWPGMLADTADAYIEAVVALYSDRQRWHQAVAAGEALLPRFATGPHNAALAARLTQLSDALEVQRQGNFIGAMLRHHSLRSHQYMSQWIAAKHRLAAQLESDTEGNR